MCKALSIIVDPQADEGGHPFVSNMNNLTKRSTIVDFSGLLVRNSQHPPTSVLRQ